MGKISKKLNKYIASLITGTFLIAFIPSPTLAATPSVPILMYHYIRNYDYPQDPEGIRLSVSPANFDAQMAYLAQNGYTPITLNTLWAIYNRQVSSPAKPVVITFDDGSIDLYVNAYPILKKYNFQAVSFVIPGFVGKPAYLSWDNIREMNNSGLIEFEDHTQTHAYLPKIGYQNLVYQLLESKKELEGQLGHPVNFIAYPYGASNFYIQKLAAKFGYVGGVGTWYGKSMGKGMNIPRIRVNGKETLSAFARSL